MEKIKKILLMENKAFEIIHVISLICIFVLAISIAIEKILISKMEVDDNNNFLEEIEIIEDTNTDTIISNTHDSNEVLLNPGKGMVYYGTKNNSQYNDIVSVGYTRFNWCDIEPAEGVWC